MKFQNPSFKFLLNRGTNKRTNEQTDKPKAISKLGHNYTIHVAKTKALISFTVTGFRICKRPVFS